MGKSRKWNIRRAKKRENHALKKHEKAWSKLWSTMGQPLFQRLDGVICNKEGKPVKMKLHCFKPAYNLNLTLGE